MKVARFVPSDIEVDMFGEQNIGRDVRQHPRGLSSRCAAALSAFKKGRGAAIVAIACANVDTYDQARRNPHKYDPLRAQMGGWTGVLVTMFPAHQPQHRRRPFEVAS